MATIQQPQSGRTVPGEQGQSAPASPDISWRLGSNTELRGIGRA